jgi:hypothetical protein
MELVSCIAKTSFVNQVVGSVTRKQKLMIPASLAREFVSMGLVDYEGGEQKKPQPIQSKPSPQQATDGQEVQSVSLPVATALPINKSVKPKKGRPAKTGK